MFNGIYAAQNQQHFAFTMVLKLKQMVTHSLTLFCVVPTMKMVRTLSTTITRTWLRLWTSIVHLIWKNPFILVDTNHDNSGKNFMEQVRIVREVLLNREWDERIADTVRGFMIESYLEDGRQDTPEVYGKSITDPCLGWDKTDSLIREIHNRLS